MGFQAHVEAQIYSFTGLKAIWSNPNHSGRLRKRRGGIIQFGFPPTSSRRHRINLINNRLHIYFSNPITSGLFWLKKEMPGLTCNACNKEFKDDAEQKLHYRSDWHRYNLKRKVCLSSSFCYVRMRLLLFLILP